jgi:hypothetical protein
MVIARAKDMGHLEEICEDRDRLLCLKGRLENVGPLRQDPYKLRSVSFLEQREICALEFILTDLCFPNNRAKSGMCVLKVWTVSPSKDVILSMSNVYPLILDTD